ncbi:MAG: hypothetical protein LAP38_17220 [Acidobacteriia bacterium]|nr:hypothetical protein [Terriglobia bacterium]
MKAILTALLLLPACIPAFAQASPTSVKKEDPKLAAISQDFATGFTQALSEHRFLIVFFRDKTLLTTQEEAEVAKLRADRLFSSLFLFTQATLPDDQVGLKAAQELKVKGLPAISVLAPDQAVLREVTRFEGVFTVADLLKGIISWMCKAFQAGRFSPDSNITKPLGCASK